MKIEIIDAEASHFPQIWEIFHAVVSTGDTYVYEPATAKTEALQLWCEQPQKTFVALRKDTANDAGNVVGTYILKPNFPGLGSHIANASYMVHPDARGLGVGRKMGEHSLSIAKSLGYLGMQFNIVVSTNPALKLWESLGFKIIGTTPKGFRHATLGFIDSHILYRSL